MNELREESRLFLENGTLLVLWNERINKNDKNHD